MFKVNISENSRIYAITSSHECSMVMHLVVSDCVTVCIALTSESLDLESSSLVHGHICISPLLGHSQVHRNRKSVKFHPVSPSITSQIPGMMLPTGSHAVCRTAGMCSLNLRPTDRLCNDTVCLRIVFVVVCLN